MVFVMRDDCAYKVLRELYELYDLSLPIYIKKCETCSGNRDCKATLDQLVEARETFIEEMDLS